MSENDWPTPILMLSKCFITNSVCRLHFLEPCCTSSDGNETTYIEISSPSLWDFLRLGTSMIENDYIILKIPLKSMLNQ